MRPLMRMYDERNVAVVLVIVLRAAKKFLVRAPARAVLGWHRCVSADEEKRKCGYIQCAVHLGRGDSNVVVR